ncbi:2TM domain-containing protein [Asanoa iriomotensis]|uniref:2TM domain-containing protein n=1 Tax=Asanoa iriomotensis TaxID=234613 RepID=A0ABQ4C3G3_9ACTN|nr:2TM domain-containing protein [Asanoa iriomotensis]GIF56815.1 hypothetical protein Air01nite_29100 [Asanoa iriomotensis]
MTTTPSATAQIWGLRIHVLCYLVSNVIQVIVWWYYTPDQFFWPLWSILGWAVWLIIHYWWAKASIAKTAKR